MNYQGFLDRSPPPQSGLTSSEPGGHGPLGHGTHVVAVREGKLVRAVDDVVVRESLEECNGCRVMVVLPSRGWGPAGPVHGNIFGVTLSKSLPKRTSGSGIPSIVQRRHQID